MTILSKFINYLCQNRKLIARFGFVGIVTLIFNYSLVWFFYGVFKLDYRIAITMAFIIAVVVNFTLSRVFTYKATSASIMHHIWKYVIVLIINYAINIFVSIIVVGIYGLSPYLAIILATIITTCSGFLLMKYFVFLRGV